MVASVGLPTILAYGFYVGEVIAPIQVLLGYWALVGALIIAINMAVALALVHMSQLVSLADTGGRPLELTGFLFSPQ